MNWKSDRQQLSDSERDELMAVGERVAREIKNLIAAGSPTIAISSRNGATIVLMGTGADLVRSLQIVLSFIITDLGGSSEEDLRRFVKDQLLAIFAQPSMIKYKLQWVLKC